MLDPEGKGGQETIGLINVPEFLWMKLRGIPSDESLISSLNFFPACRRGEVQAGQGLFSCHDTSISLSYQFFLDLRFLFGLVVGLHSAFLRIRASISSCLSLPASCSPSRRRSSRRLLILNKRLRFSGSVSLLSRRCDNLSRFSSLDLFSPSQ